MKFNFRTIILMTIPFFIYIIFENIQKYIVADHTLIYEKNTLSLMLFFAALVYLNALLIDFLENHMNPLKYIYHRIGIVISVIILFLAPTYYYFCTNKGITNHELFTSKFYSWDQVKEVQLEMTNSKGGVGLEYYLVFDQQEQINIFPGVLLIYSNSEEAIFTVDQILHQYKVPFKIPDYIIENLNEFSSCNQVLINNDRYSK